MSETKKNQTEPIEQAPIEQTASVKPDNKQNEVKQSEVKRKRGRPRGSGSKQTGSKHAGSSDKALVKQGETKPKKKWVDRGSPLIGENAYLFKDNEEKKAYIQKTMMECLEIYKMPKVHSDEELVERIDWYFRRCAERGIKPTVEELCMSTGYLRTTLWDWETGRKGGFTSTTGNIIRKSKEFMANFDAKLVNEGKLNPVTYIFRSKNYYGMRDQQEYVITPNAPTADDPATLMRAAGLLPDGSDE